MPRRGEPDPYALVALLAADVHDGDPEHARSIWEGLDGWQQWAVCVVALCQLPAPHEVTLFDLRRRVDEIAGVKADG